MTQKPARKKLEIPCSSKEVDFALDKIQVFKNGSVSEEEALETAHHMVEQMNAEYEKTRKELEEMQKERQETKEELVRFNKLERRRYRVVIGLSVITFFAGVALGYSDKFTLFDSLKGTLDYYFTNTHAKERQTGREPINVPASIPEIKRLILPPLRSRENDWGKKPLLLRL